MKASFIDLGGNTARVDPQTTPTAYIRLQIFWQAVYDDSSGAEVNSPRAGEIYMTVEQADVLAEALKNARMSKAQETPPAVVEPFTAAQPEQTPLTKEQIDEFFPIGMGPYHTIVGEHNILKFVRTIEAAHGIKPAEEQSND